MEYLTGVRHKDTLEISELRKQAQPGQTVKVNGAVACHPEYGDSGIRHPEKTGGASSGSIRRRNRKV